MRLFKKPAQYYIWDAVQWFFNTLFMIIAFFGYRIFVFATFLFFGIKSLFFPEDNFNILLAGFKKIDSLERLQQSKRLHKIQMLIKKKKRKKNVKN